MIPKRHMRLNAFDMACVGHIQHGMWTHPRDRSTDYTSLDHWVSLARLLEKGLFDGLFLADVLGVYDVFEGSPAPSLRNAVQIPLIDPMALVPAMAHATTNLGFGVTCNLAYEAPFLFARRMATLDHLTRGRIGWNIVTGYLDSAARAMGFAGQMAHDDRYDFADEYMAAVYRLWEGGWRDDAVVRDRAGGIYTDPSRVRAVHHHGKQFHIDAVPLWEPSPQRTPVLYQAGASDRGRVFAAHHAECVFVNGSTPANVRRIVSDLRARAAPRPMLAFVGCSVVTARTEKEARDVAERLGVCQSNAARREQSSNPRVKDLREHLRVLGCELVLGYVTGSNRFNILRLPGSTGTLPPMVRAPPRIGGRRP